MRYLGYRTQRQEQIWLVFHIHLVWTHLWGIFLVIYAWNKTCLRWTTRGQIHNSASVDKHVNGHKVMTLERFRLSMFELDMHVCVCICECTWVWMCLHMCSTICSVVLHWRFPPNIHTYTWIDAHMYVCAHEFLYYVWSYIDIQSIWIRYYDSTLHNNLPSYICTNHAWFAIFPYACHYVWCY